MHKYYHIPFLFLFVIASQLSFSQEVTTDKYTRFVNYTQKHGLSNNDVNDIIQDDKGFMWFATENGLSRFDGYSFVNFYHDANNDNSLPGDVITSLTLDSKNNLWIGTTQGLCRLSLNSGVIERFYAKADDLNSPRTNHIRKVYYSEKDNTLWIETVEGTLSAYNLTLENWAHYNHTPIRQPYYRYHTLFEDSGGNIWVGGRNTPVMKLDATNKTFRYFNAKGEEHGSKRDDDAASVFETPNGQWFVVGLDGIYEFFPNSERFNKLLGTSTYSITQDADGFIWFASGKGLLKYCNNSQKFKNFQHNQNNPNSLTNNHVKKVYIDRVGNIWAGTRRGVSLLSQKSKLFAYYYQIPGDEQTLSANDISALAEDADGTVYIGTANNGLNKWRFNESKFKPINADISDKCSLSSNNISSLYFDENGDLWVGLWAGLGFNKYNPKTGCFTRYAMDNLSRKSDWYNDFLEDSNGNFLIGLWGASGAIYFDRENGKFTDSTFIDYKKPYEKSVEIVHGNGFGKFFFLTPSRTVIYTYNSIINEYSSKTHQDALPQSQRPISGRDYLPLSFNHIHSITSSSDGLTYFGTDKGIIGHTKDDQYYSFHQGLLNSIYIKAHNQSVYVLELGRLLVFNTKGNLVAEVPLHNYDNRKLLFTDDEIYIIGNETLKKSKIDKLTEPDSWQSIALFENNVLVDAKILDNILWIGSRNGLFNFKLRNGSDSLLLKNLSTILNLPISSFVKAEDDLFVFSPIGLYVVNTSTHDSHKHQFNKYQFNKVPKDFNYSITSAIAMNADTIWLGNVDGHFQFIISQKKIVQTNLPGNNRASSRLVSTLMEDDEGNIWIGTTDKGLNRVDAKTGFIYHFFKGSSETSLPSNRINSIIQSVDGKIWVATDKGLCYVANNSIFRVTDSQLQVDIRSLTEDQNGLLWAGSSMGLFSIDPSTTEIHFYDESSGLPTAEFSKASIKLSNGYLAFGSSRGFFAFNPTELNSSADYSNVLAFTHFNVFDHSIRNTFKQNDTLTLHYSQNFFEIGFTANDFGQKPGTTFKYKLDGVDPDWVHTKTQNVSYTNISPGKYLFEVTKILPSGEPSRNYATLFVNIKPAFWQTTWFRYSIIMLVVGGVLAYLTTYIRQLKADRLNVELEQRLLISQMNPHFIFNSLSAIQSFIYGNNTEEAGNYLSSFSRLIRLILENSRSNLISIRQEIQTLELYLSLQKLRFPDKFSYIIDIDDSIKESDIKLPPMLAQPFIENSIEHGIMHKDGMGNIFIAFRIAGQFMTIIVEDDGIGYEKSKEINKNSRLSHSSLATSITRERIKNISRKSSNKVGVNITDLSKENKNGTRVEITFPFFTKQVV